MQISPYLFLYGQAEEAIHFYADVLMAQILGIQRYKEVDPSITGANANKVFHAIIRFGNQTMMFTDRLDEAIQPKVSDLVLSVHFLDLSKMRAVFKAFAEGGTVVQELHKTPWKAEFGHVVDYLGVHWMLNAPFQSE
jgi:PhnB protein